MRGLTAPERFMLIASMPGNEGLFWHVGDPNEAALDAAHERMVLLGWMTRRETEDHVFYNITKRGRVALECDSLTRQTHQVSEGRSDG